MIYVFHDNQLFYQGDKKPGILPDHAYVAIAGKKAHWWYKHKRAELRSLHHTHIPKEIRLLCLLLNIPLQG